MKFRRLPKILSLLFAVVIALSALAGCSNNPDKNTAAKESITLRLADMSVYGIAIFNYAQEIGLLDGYFADLDQYDITIKLTEWASGVAQNEAFAANSIDFSVMGNQPAVSGSARGIGTKIIAVNYLYDNEYVFVARKDAGISSIADVKGKKVGTYFGTVTHYAVSKYLEGAGLSTEDVAYINTAAESQTAFLNGDVDATVLENVVARKLEAAGDAVILSDKQVPIYNYVVAREAFAQKYPDIATRVLKLINETWDYASAHQDEYAAFYAEKSGLELANIQAAWAGGNFPNKHASDFSESDKALYDGFVAWLIQAELIDADVNGDSLLDLSYVRGLK